MKNQDYIRKYSLGEYAEIGNRPIDNEDNARKFSSDIYYEYKSLLDYYVIKTNIQDLQIKVYDQVFAQMKQKLDGLSKKIPYGLPDKFYHLIDNLYYKFMEEYCVTFHNQIENMKTWPYKNTIRDDKWYEFFKQYPGINTFYRNLNITNLSKYPKLVQFAYEIYKQKRKEYEENEKREELKKQQEHNSRMKEDPEYRQKHMRNSFYNFFYYSFNNDFFNSFFGDPKLIGGLFKNNIPISSFEILGLTEQATMDDIKTSYRKLSMQYHPDRGGNQEKFIEITEAKNKCIDYLQFKIS